MTALRKGADTAVDAGRLDVTLSWTAGGSVLR